MSEADRAKASKIAEKVKHAVERSVFEKIPRPITISIGGACYPEDGGSRDELLIVVDDALCRAKEMGGNRVVLGPDIKGS
jgi:diguanylate cyclase (GGDEF)-like protein